MTKHIDPNIKVKMISHVLDGMVKPYNVAGAASFRSRVTHAAKKRTVPVPELFFLFSCDVHEALVTKIPQISAPISAPATIGHLYFGAPNMVIGQLVKKGQW